MEAIKLITLLSRGPSHPVVVNYPTALKPPGQLGPNQIAWCRETIRHMGAKIFEQMESASKGTRLIGSKTGQGDGSPTN